MNLQRITGSIRSLEASRRTSTLDFAVLVSYKMFWRLRATAQKLIQGKDKFGVKVGCTEKQDATVGCFEVDNGCKCCRAAPTKGMNTLQHKIFTTTTAVHTTATVA